ncbi:hypothetical protein [Streptomyces sp. TLI_146]|uniref:hypothetical protein n=1 Tax=Streptomyces sp. TLI_146 TaxID=1938858 RepID=UPI000C702F32|nr:hypothetical protein [Streptomyces sp. TLI_146]
MIDRVLEIFTQMADGTAVAAGTGVGQAVSDVVRERLATTDRGRTAMHAVAGGQRDPDAISELRTLLQAEVDSDPDFARRLSEAMAGPRPAEVPRSTTHSITFENATLRGRNTISLGPVTFNNTRNNRLSLLAAALVLVALVAIGIYGGARMITGSGPGRDEAVTALNSVSLHQVLPTQGSLPVKWTQPRPAETLTAAQGPGLIVAASVDYLMGDPEAKVSFLAAACSNAEKAHDFFNAVKKSHDGSGRAETDGLTVPMPKIGDEQWAVAGHGTQDGPGGGFITLRVGTVVLSIQGTDTDRQPFATSRLEVLARMMAERAQQAQNGQTPSAFVRDA